MNFIENAIGLLILLAVAAAFAGPALALNRHDRRIDKELKAAERGEGHGGGGRRSKGRDRYTRAA